MKTKQNQPLALSTFKSTDIGWKPFSLILFLVLFSIMPKIKAQTNLPDNIIDAGCYVAPPVMKWAIREVPNTLDSIFANVQTPLIGDIDEDGETEIVITGRDAFGTGNYVDKIHIIGATSGVLKKSFDIVRSYAGANVLAAMGRIQWTPNVYKNVIFVLSNDETLAMNNNGEAGHHLYAYDANGTRLWTSDVKFSTTKNEGAAVQLIDVDGDGWVELVVSNKVYAAETGKLLCVFGTNTGVTHSWTSSNHATSSNFLLHSMAGDILGNGKQQICVGNTIYEVSLAGSRARNISNAGNTATLVKTIPIANAVWNGASYETPPTTDGSVQLVDLDGDGHLDVVVSTVRRIEGTATQEATSAFYIYVWSHAKQKIIASKKLNNIYKRSVPFLGNIDKKDKYPEIVLVHGAVSGNNTDTRDKITALKYNPNNPNGELEIFWQLDHDDSSGVTGITLFDFNQDGISELVYRDNTNLRIINGSKVSHITGNDTTKVYDLAVFACSSATAWEYPVVADIDNDGQAEIITTGQTTKQHYDIGPLRIFKAGIGTSWAPARRVWNQFSYNAVHVNEDLTIPRWPLNPATIFPGEDGIMGTADDLQPFNNFLQQQTMLSQDGVPFWLVARAEIVDNRITSLNYDAKTDLMTVSLKVENLGDAAIQNPFYVTAYRNNVGNAVKHTYQYQNMIFQGATATITFGIPNFKASSWQPCSSIAVRINDSGNGYSHQIVCDSTNRDASALLIMATADNAKTVNNLPVTIPVINNDQLLPTCHPPVITTQPLHGTATVVGNQVVYTPTASYVGNDVLTYTVTCTNSDGSIVSTSAQVNITVYDMVKPGVIGTTKEICYNSNPGLISVGPATGGDGSGAIQYQWQRSTDGTNWSNISGGATSVSYNSGFLTTTTWFRRQAIVSELSPTNKTVYSNEVKITVLPNVAASFTATTNYGTGKIDIINTSTVNGTAANASTPGVTWQWKDEDTNAVLTTGFQPTNIDIPVKANGIFRLTLVASVSNDCTPSTHTEEMQVLVNVDITVFFRGPLQNSTGLMTNYIQEPVTSSSIFTTPKLPTTAPASLGVTATCPSINNSAVVGKIVDWVRVEIRKVSDHSILEAKALLLRTNGKIVDLNGNVPGFTPQATQVYLVVKHRNHLSVVSNVIPTLTAPITYDFSNALNKAIKLNSNDPDSMHKAYSALNVWAMWAGDIDRNEIINHTDRSLGQSSNGKQDAYYDEDLDMNGIVNHTDNTILQYSVSFIVYSPLLSW